MKEQYIYQFLLIDVKEHVKMSVCVDAMSYIYHVWGVLFHLHWITCLGKCWCIHCCLWFTCLFIRLKNRGIVSICEIPSLIVLKTPIHPGVIHRWDSSSVYKSKTTKTRMEWNGRQTLHNEPQINGIKQIACKTIDAQARNFIIFVKKNVNELISNSITKHVLFFNFL